MAWPSSAAVGKIAWVRRLWLRHQAFPFSGVFVKRPGGDPAGAGRKYSVQQLGSGSNKSSAVTAINDAWPNGRC